jgi:tungstate transport system substrate-binding protein
MKRRPGNPISWAGLLTVGLFVVSPVGHPTVSSQASSVRLALVVVPDDILRPLLPEFQSQTGFSAEIVFTGEDPYDVARRGQADMVISHYGHPGVERFVLDGLGLWPHAVFANQTVLLGPPTDPARVRGLTDAAEAFWRIAQTESPFLVNGLAGQKYVEDILWTVAGSPAKGRWYADPNLEGQQAVQAAARSGAYVLWGLQPFLRLQRQNPLPLQPLVMGDPLFQRIMVSVVVNPRGVPGVNALGATAFQNYLIAPGTQARIRAFRYPDLDQQAWWPSGRHNSARE